MQDQADTLRRLMNTRRRFEEKAGRESPRPSAPVVTVASGKGGVGKSCLVANVGSALAREGMRVLLVDGDFGLANLDVLLGVHRGSDEAVTLEDVVADRAGFQEAVIGVEPNLWLLPAAAGLMEMKAADPISRASFVRVMENCPWEMDLILVDVGAGIHPNVLSLHHPDYSSIIVLTPEPTSLTDAYGLIKTLRAHSAVTQVQVVVNQVTDGREAQRCFQKLKDVAARFVDVELEYLGHWERDEKVSHSVMKRKILLDLEGGSPSLEFLARRLRSKIQAKNHGRFKEESMPGMSGNISGFWRTLLGEVNA